MRILSVAFPAMSVGTDSGGGAEQILSILEAGLVEAGHESIVVAARGSRVTGELVETPAREPSARAHRTAIERVVAEKPPDLIHFHGLDFHEYVPDCDVPMLATLHLPLSFYPASVFMRRVLLNCVSQSQANSAPEGAGLLVVANGIPTSQYTPGTPHEYLLWLGRICPEKGVHMALEVAHRLDRSLIVAGPVHPYEEHQRYFEDRVRPLLDDRRTYAGPVEGVRKCLLLSRANCLLIPSLVAETSSLVAMEALSSGTPVVAFRSGALPEVVEEGVTGFVVDTADQMAAAIGRVDQISRERCRERAVARFDSRRMVRDYLDLYGWITSRDLGILSAPQRNL